MAGADIVVVQQLIRWLAPAVCVRCSREGDVVCDDCFDKIAVAKSSTCFSCNAQTVNFSTCRSCRRQTCLRRVYVASHYDRHVKQLVTLLKYHNAVDAAVPLAEMLYLQFRFDCDLLVPVPSSTRRLRQRGYNPAALIGKRLSRISKVPFRDVLGRLGHTRQVGSTRNQRVGQLAGKIYIKKPHSVKGRRVLLVDDVVTTGATLNECAMMLRRAGAKTIEAVVVAKH